jgi:hypothetical protein
MIATMPVMMGMGMAQSPGMDLAAMESMSRILEGEVRVLLSLAKQCEIFELVLEPKDSGLRVNETLVPAAGTRLAALLNAPKVTTSNPKVQSCMLADAAIAIDCTLANPQALTDFFCEEIELVLKEMDVESEAIAGMTDAMKQWAGLYNGSFSESVDFGGDSFINLAYALDIKSEADVISMFKSIEQDMAGLLEIYKSFGVPMTIAFKENVREHHEANIHHFKVNMTMPAEDAAAAAEMNLDFSNLVYEVAVCDGLLLVAMGETKVETLIDRVKTADFKAAPLKARGVYPADAVFYCDVDVARYMEGISSIMPADPSNPMPQMAAMLKGADPVTSAGFRENGMVMWSVNVPGSLLAKFGQAAMAVQMQQIQQMKNMQQMPAQPPQTFEVPMAPGAMPSGLEAVPLP